MITPLKILFVWHHHQPYYKSDGTFLMPWVRMHGIKDYWDMVRILDDYPGIKQTFNFAPSLLEQIRDYLQLGVPRNAVNMPHVSAEEYKKLEPYIQLGEKLGAF
ncbi:MAG: hypothetical protein M1339_06515, partial [Bacteroidetes bacterium]|nr:hypothetical protein [Bacteroidota bacterium]